MRIAAAFLFKLIKEARDDDLFILSNELSYKILLAVFPLIIFIMTILGFLNIDAHLLMIELSNMMPDEIMEVLNVFVEEVIYSRNISLLSTSFIVAVYSSSSGFKAVIRGVNRTYGQQETRGFIKVQLISVALVFIFTLLIAAMLVLLIFGNSIVDFLYKYITIPYFIDYFFSFSSLLITMFVLLAAVMIIYKIANSKKVGFISVFPGAAVTVIFWLIFSKCFNIYIRNFARYSRIYGSIAGIFILIIWLNLIVTLLLIGSEINAMLWDSAEIK